MEAGHRGAVAIDDLGLDGDEIDAGPERGLLGGRARADRRRQQGRGGRASAIGGGPRPLEHPIRGGYRGSMAGDPSPAFRIAVRRWWPARHDRDAEARVGVPRIHIGRVRRASWIAAARAARARAKPARPQGPRSTILHYETPRMLPFTVCSPDRPCYNPACG